MFRYSQQKILSLLLVVSAAGCGGGGGGSTAAAPSPAPATPLPSIAPVTGSTMTMSCVDGANFQCSGDAVIRSDNGVALTRSGVQVYGKSTNDLVTPIADVTKATGLALATGGIAEVRLAKDAGSVASSAALLLSKLGITWDSRVDRPQIIETFNPTQGSVTLGANGALTAAPLVDNSNLNYYDYASKGTAATQANYANNRYFPRTGNPSRCATPPCRTTETAGLQNQGGNWRSGGATPDFATASRFHEDGDIHAGNGKPDASGNPTLLPGASGVGVPFPGSKGGRDIYNWGLQYGNLTAWLTQDTVEINDWVGGNRYNEHNNNRRGVVAFGDVSLPNAVPVTGTATYSGVAYGWYAGSATEDAVFFRGAATITVDFATRAVIVKLLNTVTNNSAATPVPVALTGIAAMGTAGDNGANYLTGPVDNGKLSGGLSGRYFGPAISTANSDSAPAELGGAFSMANASTGATAIGGFISRKQ